MQSDQLLNHCAAEKKAYLERLEVKDAHLALDINAREPLAVARGSEADDRRRLVADRCAAVLVRGAVHLDVVVVRRVAIRAIHRDVVSVRAGGDTTNLATAIAALGVVAKDAHDLKVLVAAFGQRDDGERGAERGREDQSRRVRGKQERGRARAERGGQRGRERGRERLLAPRGEVAVLLHWPEL